MAITRDGTQAFGIEDSPITINSVTYVMENFSATYGSNVPEVMDGNGEAIGRTIVPTPVEGSATLQLAEANTALPTLGMEFTTSGNRNADTYIITEVGDTQTQGDYEKVNISFYAKIN